MSKARQTHDLPFLQIAPWVASHQNSLSNQPVLWLEAKDHLMDILEFFLEILFELLSALFPDLHRFVPTWLKWSFVLITVPLLLWIALN
jgi:hypothetical protein